MLWKGSSSSFCFLVKVCCLLLSCEHPVLFQLFKMDHYCVMHKIRPVKSKALFRLSFQRNVSYHVLSSNLCKNQFTPEVDFLRTFSHMGKIFVILLSLLLSFSRNIPGLKEFPTEKVVQLLTTSQPSSSTFHLSSCCQHIQFAKWVRNGNPYTWTVNNRF